MEIGEMESSTPTLHSDKEVHHAGHDESSTHLRV